MGFDFTTPHSAVPSLPAKAKVRHAFRDGMTGFVVGADFCPVISSAAVLKWRGLRAQAPTFDSLDPGGVAEAELFRAFDEAVALVVIGLHRGPVVYQSSHAIIVE